MKQKRTAEIEQMLKVLDDREVKKKIRQITKTVRGTNTISQINNLTITHPNGLFANELDMKILSMVFKWKVLPLFMLKAALYRDGKEKTFDKRVERLVRKGLLKRVRYIGTLTLFELTDAGFLRFKQNLDGFKEEGFSSEHIWHDFLVMGLQFGIWAQAKPKTVELVTEQEMRRFYLKELPRWMPAIANHRPDGFTSFRDKSGSKTIAYEIEISQKAEERYGPVLQYYNSNPDIDLVLWMVKNKSLRNLIVENIHLIGEQNLGKHCFILLDDFKTSFWNAMVESDQQPSRSLVELMSDYSRQPVDSLSECCRKGMVSDFQRVLLKS